MEERGKKRGEERDKDRSSGGEERGEERDKDKSSRGEGEKGGER